jgi:uncharacterized protein (DUF433 family)
MDFPRITIIPDVCNGKPTIRGMRITVNTILEFLGAGDTKETLLIHYPMLEEEDLNECIRFATFAMNEKFNIVPNYKSVKLSN